MSNPPPIPVSVKPKSKGTPMWFWYCVLVFAVLVIGVISSFSIWRWRLDHEIKSRVAAIHTQGLPINWEELSHWPSAVPDSENGAFIYTNAFAHLKLDHLENHLVILPERDETLSGSNLAIIKAVVENNRDALKILYSAGKYSKFRYPVDYTYPISAKLPHLAHLRAASRLLGCESFLEAKAGDAEAAIKGVKASLHLSDSLENEPLLISQLVAEAMLQESCKSLERVLCRVELSEHSLLELSNDLAKANATNHILTGEIGERAVYAEYLRLLTSDVRRAIILSNQSEQEGDKAEVPNRNPGIGWRYLGFEERDRNFYLRAMETNLLIATMPPPKSLSFTNEQDQIEKQAQDGFFLVSSLILPSLHRMPQRIAMGQATVSATSAAIAVERWRKRHDDKLPDSLDSLVPDYFPSVPIDPYNGQPLKFKKMSKGYVIYSVGPDLQDDGGKPEPSRGEKKKKSSKENFDITFTVER